MESVNINKVREQVDQFISDTIDARTASERDRDYKDHKQWSESEIKKLLKRKHAPVVANRIRPKVEGLVGLYILRHTDPKAYPRTQKHEKSAHAITDALRYVADNTDFERTKYDVCDEFFVEGYGGVMVHAVEARGQIEIEISHIPWDRIYFDPHSRDKYFEDARYKGMMVWMSADEIKEKFPDADIQEMIDVNEGGDETFDDRPRYSDRKRDRYRVALHFFIHKGVWHYCAFSGDYWLIEPEVSPYLDCDGDPVCPIEIVSANIDRDNMRYGEVRGWITMQDEINQRRSKALHLLSQRQTAARKGAISNIQAMKNELSKPDGHVEYLGEKGDFEILSSGDMAQGQVLLHQEAKQELDSVSFNAQLSGERQMGDLSGRAIDKLQSAGTIELNRQYNYLVGWEKRVYRQVWARIKQFWDQERWIRVTDNQDSLRFVGLNTQITAKEWMEEQIEDESLPMQRRNAIEASYTFLMQAAQGPSPDLIQAAQQGDQQALQAVIQASQLQPIAQQKLEEFVAIRNPVPEIDADIIVDQSFDVVNAQQEQFAAILEFAKTTQDIDIIELLELSNLRNKDALIEKIEQRRAQAAQQGDSAQMMAAQQAQAKAREINARATKLEQEAIEQQIENQVLVGGKASVDVAKAESDIARNEAETTQKNLENMLLLTDPDRITNVSV